MSKLLQRPRNGYAAFTTYAHEHELGAKLKPVLTLLGVLAFLALVALAIWIVSVVPIWQVNRTLDLKHQLTLDKQLELEDNFRKTITQIVLSVFGLILLYFTWRRSVAGDKTVRIMEQGHITDRFTKAIEQLGKFNDNDTPNIEVRLGAIYALERIAIDSPRDHWTIMEILTAYVRENAPLDPKRPYVEGEKPRTDVQAILTVLGRRRTSPKRERNDQLLDLAQTRLCGTNLAKANLQMANLREANLQNAILREVKLQGATLWRASLRDTNLGQASLQWAYLVEANLQDATLERANLQDAILWKANLQDAILIRSNLREANLEEADLQDANLMVADLRGTKGLTSEQLTSANNWQRARYSDELRTELGLPLWPNKSPRPEPSVPKSN